MKEVSLKQESLILDNRIDEFLRLSSQRERLQQEISRNNERSKKIMKMSSDHRPDGKAGDLSKEIADVIQSIQENNVPELHLPEM